MTLRGALVAQGGLQASWTGGARLALAFTHPALTRAPLAVFANNASFLFALAGIPLADLLAHARALLNALRALRPRGTGAIGQEGSAVPANELAFQLHLSLLDACWAACLFALVICTGFANVLGRLFGIALLSERGVSLGRCRSAARNASDVRFGGCRREKRFYLARFLSNVR